jgi:hypothetical protein
MRVLELRDVQRKDTPIYYRRFYTGTLVLELMQKNVERGIDFSVELMPTGHKHITIAFDQPVDYPMVPLLREIKSYIDELDRKGGLPL